MTDTRALCVEHGHGMDGMASEERECFSGNLLSLIPSLALRWCRYGQSEEQYEFRDEGLLP